MLVVFLKLLQLLWGCHCHYVYNWYAPIWYILDVQTQFILEECPLFCVHLLLPVVAGLLGARVLGLLGSLSLQIGRAHV